MPRTTISVEIAATIWMSFARKRIRWTICWRCFGRTGSPTAVYDAAATGRDFADGCTIVQENAQRYVPAIAALSHSIEVGLNFAAQVRRCTSSRSRSADREAFRHRFGGRVDHDARGFHHPRPGSDAVLGRRRPRAVALRRPRRVA